MFRSYALKWIVRVAMFVTRAQYDRLVTSEAVLWMAMKWLKLRRSWSIGGVTVSGDESIIAELRILVR